MSRLFDEGNLQFEFSARYVTERFDDARINAYGLKAVDFVAEDADCLYFIEVKDFQHPQATPDRRISDYKMLIAAGTDKKSVFNLEMGVKIKDSLLREGKCPAACGEKSLAKKSKKWYNDTKAQIREKKNERIYSQIAQCIAVVVSLCMLCKIPKSSIR